MQHDPLPQQPGWFHFTDAIGAPAERVEVVDDAGELCARFNDDGDIELVPVRDMAGSWAPVG
jgi:hypothetical protein